MCTTAVLILPLNGKDTAGPRTTFPKVWLGAREKFGVPETKPGRPRSEPGGILEIVQSGLLSMSRGHAASPANDPGQITLKERNTLWQLRCNTTTTCWSSRDAGSVSG
jgi:hypothetical protein